ncbi:MAG: hypothetical protein GF416_03385 [Candidatus Altiarchaeales archaeon]|nr:hypothetical protein [Candidatus Altiarchaeales archaeon]MBD3416162.1 hypothetical protein [Candidatus Altiarchaeales archaeon]
MAGSECRTCSMRGVCRDSKSSWIFFLIGVIATVALRVIGPLDSVNPMYARLSWYVGVAGFFIFFIFKYRESRRRSKIIRSEGLKEKLVSGSDLSESEYMLLAEIVCSQDNWKEQANFLIIFALSGVALLIALWMDLVG